MSEFEDKLRKLRSRQQSSLTEKQILEDLENKIRDIVEQQKKEDRERLEKVAKDKLVPILNTVNDLFCEGKGYVGRWFEEGLPSGWFKDGVPSEQFENPGTFSGNLPITRVYLRWDLPHGRYKKFSLLLDSSLRILFDPTEYTSPLDVQKLPPINLRDKNWKNQVEEQIPSLLERVETRQIIHTEEDTYRGGM